MGEENYLFKNFFQPKKSPISPKTGEMGEVF